MEPKTPINWTHPSCRDLVIEELANDSVLRDKFLSKTSLEGIKISVSNLGGSTGERSFPLLISKND